MITAAIIIFGIAAFLAHSVNRCILRKENNKKKQLLYRQWESHWRNASAELLSPPLKPLPELLSNPNSGNKNTTHSLITEDIILSLIEFSTVINGDKNKADSINKLRKLLNSALVNHWIFRFYNEGNFPLNATSIAYAAILNQLSLQELISEARHHQDDLKLCEYIHYWVNRV